MEKSKELVWFSNFTNFNLIELNGVVNKVWENTAEDEKPPKLYLLKTKITEPFQHQVRKKIVAELMKVLSLEIVVWEFDLEVDEFNQNRVTDQLGPNRIILQNQFLDLKMERLETIIIPTEHKMIKLANKYWFLQRTWDLQRQFDKLVNYVGD